jgi:hypothetical protein
MVPLVGVATRPLFFGLWACLFLATVCMISNAVQFQESIASKRLDFGDERVKPNIDGHGPDFQAVDTIDPAVRGSPSQASDISDPLPAEHSSGNGARGNRTLPHINRLRVAVDTTDPTVRGRPIHAADLLDPLPADHSAGNGTRGNSTLPHINRLQVAVETAATLRGSPSQAPDLGDPLPADTLGANGPHGKSTLPYINRLRVAVDTTDPTVRGRPAQAAVLGDPFVAFYPPGISTEGNSSLPHVSGLRVAFVGDSLTRYMYLSLATYLRRGRWITKKDVPNILEERQFHDWNLFYNYTMNSLQPNEQCDCFRPRRIPDTIENRYFADPVQDNVLYYIQK